VSAPRGVRGTDDLSAVLSALGRGWLIGGMLLICSAVAPASADQAPQVSGRPWTLGVYLGGSRHSPVGRYWGVTPDRDHVQVGLHATIPIIRRPRWSFNFAPEVTPLMIVTNNPTYRRALAPDGSPTVVEGASKPVAAVGFAPIGLEGQQRITRRLALYQAGALGALWFTRQAPVLDSRAFNFTFEFGAGLLWTMTPETALRLGYKFHHFSNAKTAPQNPGVDAEMFFIGVDRTFASARRRSS
jgi:hypothetical protein